MVKRYINGVDVEAGTYWVLPSGTDKGVDRQTAEAFVAEQGDWPFRLSDTSRQHFPGVKR